MKRIGHKGAALIEAGNTIASFEAARWWQVDMIEFDVLRWRGRLVIAHDLGDARRRESTMLTLEQGLDHLARTEFAGIGLDVDMKHAGFELELLDSLAARELVDRTIVTTMHVESLAKLRAADRRLRLGLTIPHVRRDWLALPRAAHALIWGGVQVHRLLQPVRVSRLLRAGAIDAVMAFHAVVTPRLVRSVHAAGGDLYTWTVDDPIAIARLAGLGVDGIVSNDPRLFTEALGTASPTTSPANKATEPRL